MARIAVRQAVDHSLTVVDHEIVIHIIDEHTETEQHPHDRGEQDHTKRVPTQYFTPKQHCDELWF